MATAVHIPVSEYLRTFYRPDCDYVDGEVLERNFGEQSHNLVQKMIALIFTVNRQAGGTRSITEQRVSVSGTRYPIPDICVVSSADSIQTILTNAPLLCIEVLSPEDRLQRMVTRVQDYRMMGVEHIWIIDPETRECWTIDRTSGGALLMLQEAFTIPGTPVRVAIADVFEEIDAAPRA